MSAISRPKILITNDDGIFSPGLLAAVEAVAGICEVSIIAPAFQQTAMGRARTGQPDACLQKQTLPVKGIEFEAYSCDASPAKTVDHGLKVFPDLCPDFIISGINYGENLGANITGSGTVGAALEGASRCIPSIAVSLETSIDSHFSYTEQNWDIAIYFLRHFMEIILCKGFPKGVDVLKIDIPASATRNTPWRLTRLSRNVYYDMLLPSPTIGSLLKEAVTTKGVSSNEPNDTDIYALAIDKVVSVTPLTIDQTAYGSFSFFTSWRE